MGDPVAPRKLSPLLSANAEEIVLHAMARQPYDRYQTIAGMKKELDDIETVMVTGRAEKFQPPAIFQNMRTILLVMAIPIVTLVIFVIVLLLKLRAASH